MTQLFGGREVQHVILIDAPWKEDSVIWWHCMEESFIWWQGGAKYPLIDYVLFIATNIFKLNLILGALGGSQRHSFHKQLGSKRLQKRLSGSFDTHVAYLLLQMIIVWLKNRVKTSKTVT
jgi:hypothetical protein